MQIEKWGCDVLNINVTCANIVDTVCSQLFGANALSGCDTVSYPFGKGKASVLNTLKAGNFPELFDVVVAESAIHADLLVVGQQFFAALYGQRTGITMTQARYSLYTRKQGKPLASCYCLRRTQTFTSTCDMFTCRCCFGRQLTNMVLHMFPSQSMFGKLTMG